MSCANKMKNIGLAILNHHDVQGHFPVSMGYVDPPEAPGKQQPCAGWILQTLPQLEQQPLYDRFKEGGVRRFLLRWRLPGALEKAMDWVRSRMASRCRN